MFWRYGTQLLQPVPVVLNGELLLTHVAKVVRHSAKTLQ